MGPIAQMAMMAGQAAIVTGGGSGIGAAVARRFAEEGARVAVFDRDGEAARRVALEIGARGSEAFAFEVNVANTESMHDAVATAATVMRGLTALVNNAGIGNIKAIDAYSEREFDLLVDVNLKGTWNAIRAAAPHLASNGGCIVNVASVSGIRPTRGEAPYSAAKAGVIALTQAGALELAPHVRVNCVSPGFIDTPLTAAALADPAVRAAIVDGTPLGRAGTAEDVAGAVLFLCSGLAGYVTGHNLVVDGGSLLPSPQVDGLLRGLLGAGPGGAPDPAAPPAVG